MLYSKENAGRDIRGDIAKGTQAVLPQCIRPHSRHELLRARFRDALRGDANSCVGEKNVQTTVLLQRLIDDTLNICLLTGIDFARMDVHIRI